MDKEPAIVTRPDLYYVGLRKVMPMSDFSREIPAMTKQVFERLAADGLQLAGKAFLRYHVIDMPHRMDVELGVPVSGRAEGLLPAGRYAVLTYTGVKNGIAANKRLIDWIAQQGEHAASRASTEGEVFEARFETFLTDDRDGLDQDRWDTEVAIRLRD